MSSLSSRTLLLLAGLIAVSIWQFYSLQQLNSDCHCTDHHHYGPPPPYLPQIQHQSKQQRQHKEPPLRYPPGRQYLVPNLKPFLGQHRSSVDSAIFAMAKGYEIDDHLMTLGSLLYDTNYQGDVVLGIQPWANCSTQLQTWLTYHAKHSHLVVYTLPECKRLVPYPYDKYGHARCISTYAYQNPYNNNKSALQVTFQRGTGTDLSGRHQSARKFRYEYYWIWLQHYLPNTQIWLVDFRDLIFQSNPMEHASLKDKLSSTTLHLFEEAEQRRIIELDRFTGKMIADFWGPGMVAAIGNQTVLCSGVTLGGKVAMEQYLLKMQWHMDNLLGNQMGKGDQAHHNVLYYMGELDIEGIDSISTWKNFQGPVATTGYTYQYHPGIGNSKQQYPVVDAFGQPIPIVHQFDRSRSLNGFFQTKRQQQWQPHAEQLVGMNLTIDTTLGMMQQRKPS